MPCLAHVFCFLSGADIVWHCLVSSMMLVIPSVFLWSGRIFVASFGRVKGMPGAAFTFVHS